MPAARYEVYKCEICGNIVEVLHAGKGQLVCCGKPMVLMKENTTDAAVEKHVPVIEASETGITVKVGSTAHPMEEDHYIEWIEVEHGHNCHRHYLAPGEPPVASFPVPSTDGLTVRAYCNLHGLWKA